MGRVVFAACRPRPGLALQLLAAVAWHVPVLRVREPEPIGSAPR